MLSHQQIWKLKNEEFIEFRKYLLKMIFYIYYNKVLGFINIL